MHRGIEDCAVMELTDYCYDYFFYFFNFFIFIQKSKRKYERNLIVSRSLSRQNQEATAGMRSIRNCRPSGARLLLLVHRCCAAAPLVAQPRGQGK
jgi:hypothetical protein